LFIEIIFEENTNNKKKKKTTNNYDSHQKLKHLNLVQ